LIGRNFTEVTHPDDIARHLELVAQLLADELPFFQAQKRFIHRNGDTVWARVTVSNAAYDDGLGGRYLVSQVEDVTEIRRARDLLERRALYDHLTGLANRTLLLDRLSESLASHEPRAATVACVFLDIDHFKLVNDSLGHSAGDTLLLEISHRIQASVRGGDLVARLGGDEFVVVLENIMSIDAAKGLLASITSAVEAPLSIEGHSVAPTVSAGLALANDGVTAESLVRNSDLAMHAAKQAGRARVEVFTPSMRATALSKLSIESELRKGIREGELVVHYQPIVDMENRRTAAIEALVRWQHPQRGLLLPQDFIEICEEANLVVPLGAFVLREACEYIASHPEFTGKVLVNVSTRQIGTADLTRVVSDALRATGVTADRIGLEITESGMLVATASAHDDLRQLTALGVELILDDFGTGYSALSSVLQNPVSGLKLAREFTLRLGDNSSGDRISTAMSTLTKSLGMYGIIEGIETEAQYEIARKHGWGLGQGFLFGYPVSAEELNLESPISSASQR
jgi:diguanylate cyclase (GGDEF)-like protein